MAAVGARAAWLTADHPMNYGFGAGSPLEKLVQIDGRVLLLGSALSDVTMLHFSECVARVPGKRVVRYRQPVLQDGATVWVEVEEFDSGSGIVDWPADDDYFARITGEFLAGGGGRSGPVGAATAHLLPAPALHTFAVRWMEEHFSVRGKNPAV
jgi:aminoglycoside 3-N-acetyltransferase